MRFVLDSYAARSCPHKTINAFTPGAQPTPGALPPAFHDRPSTEDMLVERLRASAGRVVDLRGLREAPSATREAACLAALEQGADVIVAGLLPRDWAAHRSGRPFLLVRCAGGYRPVALKFHRVLEADPLDEEPVLVSTLSEPAVPLPVAGHRYRWEQRLGAALQLAHHWRLLEATGHATPEAWAGVIGLERLDPADTGVAEPVITWLDLGAARVLPNPRATPCPAEAIPVSTLERYDQEHALRVRLAEDAAAGLPAPELPIMGAECAGCGWRDRCAAQLDPDEFSLRIAKAPLDPHEVYVLRTLGVATIHDLAAADLEALVAEVLPRTGQRPGTERRLRMAHRRARMLGQGVVLERQGHGAIALARHDLEIDIDIETSADDRVYLWGFLVDEPDAPGPVYREFSRFAVLDDDAETDLARSALSWLRQVLSDRDARVYHYSDYEVVRLRRLAARFPAEERAWVQEAAGRYFVDLFSVVRKNFFGVNGLGLKSVTTSVTPFRWRDADPSGLNSQRWTADAIGDEDPEVRSASRARVIAYNEDDVRATWHLRRWLRTLD